jgi:hypothetical protein
MTDTIVNHLHNSVHQVDDDLSRVGISEVVVVCYCSELQFSSSQ